MKYNVSTLHRLDLILRNIESLINCLINFKIMSISLENRCALPNLNDSDLANLNRFKSTLIIDDTKDKSSYEFKKLVQQANIEYKEISRRTSNQFNDVFTALFVVYLEFIRQNFEVRYDSTESFVNEFPEYSSSDTDDLLLFCNWLNIFLSKNNAQNNKILAIEVFN